MRRLMPGWTSSSISRRFTPACRTRSEADFRRVNVDATAALLEAALAAKVRRFVLTSTTSVYGCTTRVKAEAIWVTEELRPILRTFMM